MDDRHESRVLLGELTSTDASRRIAAGAILLLPLGSQEDQGPHIPMGDHRCAERIAALIAQAAIRAGIDCLVVPALPFGGRDFFGSRPGGIALSQETLRAVLRDMFGCLLRHGATRMIVINGPWRQRAGDPRRHPGDPAAARRAGAEPADLAHRRRVAPRDPRRRHGLPRARPRRRPAGQRGDAPVPGPDPARDDAARTSSRARRVRPAGWKLRHRTPRDRPRRCGDRAAAGDRRQRRQWRSYPELRRHRRSTDRAAGGDRRRTDRHPYRPGLGRLLTSSASKTRIVSTVRPPASRSSLTMARL